MDSARLNDWLQIVGMLAIVASLLFVGLQIKQSQSIGEGAQAVAWMEVAVSAREAIASHSDVWIKGCMGDEMSAADDAAFAQMFRAYTQAKYFGWLSAKQGIVDTDPNVQAYSYAASVHRYPGFGQMAASWREWSREGMPSDHENVVEFVSIVNARLAKLRGIEPDPAFDAKWCGM